MSRTVIVLAAGEGKRMRSSLPKVLHPLLGRTLLGHVLAAARPLGATRTVVVVGHGADQVSAHVAEIEPGAEAVLQAEQRGTGHAVRIAAEQLTDLDGTVLVLYGDTPLLRTETLTNLLETHERSGAAATVLTAEVANPTGLGRILRDADGSLRAIVEERDATAEQRAITEINSGIYAFDGALLATALGKLTTHNDQGEEYLTDVVELLAGAGHPVLPLAAPSAVEALGCNDRAQLADARTVLRDRVNRAWMLAGVTMLDPASAWVDVTVELAPDVVLEPHIQLRGTTRVGAGAVIGPDSTLIDVYVGEGATVARTHAVDATVEAAASVGPYAYLRPGAVLRRKAKVGTFVEVKNAELGEGAKVPHLSYVGDATIGEGSNIGAASVFVNYDGVTKTRTEIGRHVRGGSDNMYVAPVRVGDGAYTGAGTVVREDVPPGALAVSAGPQRNIEGWVVRKRAGTSSARAAAEALGDDHESPAADGT